MTAITDIVQIDITRETNVVTQTNFEVPLFIATTAAFPERARLYNSADAVAEDFPKSSVAYGAIAACFQQAIKPDNVLVGRRALTNTTFVVKVPANAAVGRPFTLTINKVVFTANYAALDTDTLIAEKIASAYALAPLDGITVVADAGSLVITPEAGVVFTATGSTDVTEGESTSVEPLADAYAAIQEENNTFYLVTAQTRDETEIEAFAELIEAEKRLFGTSILPTEAGTSSETDLLSRLKAKSLFRTFVLVSNTAMEEYGELAWGAYQIQEQPGSNTWAFKTLSGITMSKFSQTQTNNIHSKNGNTYENIAGSGSTLPGKTAGGEWIDVMQFVDWLEARMRERVFFVHKNSKKVPYTAAGAALIETPVRAQLREGVRVGGLADSPAPVVFVPDVLSISPNIRAQRVFEGITFTARLAGAIHVTKIQGTVTV